MSAITQMKCACEQCLCIVSIEEAVKKDGKFYCCDACANSHADGSSCEHQGCEC